MKRIKRMYLVLVVVLLSPMAANAGPVLYEVTFGATDQTPLGGVGTFFWDDATQLISQFVWDFGGGMTGGYDETTFSWDEQIFGPGSTASTFLFEIMTGQDVDPVVSCPSCGFGRTAYGLPAGQMSFRNTPILEYQFYLPDLQTRSTVGTYSVRISPNQPAKEVSEPGTVALLGLGIVGMAARRRQRA